jgi:hypothetical protein
MLIEKSIFHISRACLIPPDAIMAPAAVTTNGHGGASTAAAAAAAAVASDTMAEAVGGADGTPAVVIDSAVEQAGAQPLGDTAPDLPDLHHFVEHCEQHRRQVRGQAAPLNCARRPSCGPGAPARGPNSGSAGTSSSEHVAVAPAGAGGSGGEVPHNGVPADQGGGAGGGHGNWEVASPGRVGPVSSRPAGRGYTLVAGLACCCACEWHCFCGHGKESDAVLTLAHAAHCAGTMLTGNAAPLPP